MSMRLHEKIRNLLETTPGLTQRGLADVMGLDPAAVNRMLYGRRGIQAEEIPVIEAYLGQSLDLTPARGVSDVRQQQMPLEYPVPSPAAGQAVVPVFAFQAGKRQPIDFVTRHPQQAGIADAFAYYMQDDSMAPRYFAGEIVYVHPHRPPQPPHDCVMVLKNGDIHILRLLHMAADKIRVQQFNPVCEKEIARKEIDVIYTVIGRG
jgi:phage repressor protein C with HTH and peptisase S24 domain